MDIGIIRDTAAFQGRWTPNDDWDIKADYSHMSRTGTQVIGLIGGDTPGSGGTPVLLPKPVDDSTQNYGVNGEKVGMSPWGQKIIFKLAYNGSTYTDNISNFTVQSPEASSRAARHERCNMAQQSGQWISAERWPRTCHGRAALSAPQLHDDDAECRVPSEQHDSCRSYALPASSLNGAINTLLSNNAHHKDHAGTHLQTDLSLLRFQKQYARTYFSRTILLLPGGKPTLLSEPRPIPSRWATSSRMPALIELAAGQGMEPGRRIQF